MLMNTNFSEYLGEMRSTRIPSIPMNKDIGNKEVIWSFVQTVVAACFTGGEGCGPVCQTTFSFF